MLWLANPIAVASGVSFFVRPLEILFFYYCGWNKTHLYVDCIWLLFLPLATGYRFQTSLSLDFDLIWFFGLQPWCRCVCCLVSYTSDYFILRFVGFNWLLGTLYVYRSPNLWANVFLLGCISGSLVFIGCGRGLVIGGIAISFVMNEKFVPSFRRFSQWFNRWLDEPQYMVDSFF